MTDVHKINRSKPEFKTLTKKEIHSAAHERVSLISQEFKEAFTFLEDLPKSVTFFGGARFNETHPLYKQAESLALRIAQELQYAVVTGGGPGVMEGANKGAFQAKGESVGLTIQLPHEQAINPYLTRHLDFYYFFSRKVCLSFAAEAYIFFPGGFGTLDEFFEILTLVQTKKIEQVPIILVGSDFWGGLQKMLKEELLSRGTIDPDDLNLYTITDDENLILDIIKKAPIRNGVPLGHFQIINPLATKECLPCEGNTAPLSHDKSEELLEQINQWVLIEDTHIEKIIQFTDFREAIRFINRVAHIAEGESHHPDIHLYEFNKVKIVLTTHAIKGLSDNDFIVAAKIDEILR
ncbi:MAG: TIGR00730 family Rossman fold protein [Candidatus Zambryskibacteria bacterium]|nr:TIGR00730 family Rossman fold protein [Candidatus Zambryskibacteria bacterium]